MIFIHLINSQCELNYDDLLKGNIYFVIIKITTQDKLIAWKKIKSNHGKN